MRDVFKRTIDDAKAPERLRGLEHPMRRVEDHEIPPEVRS